MKSLTLMLDSDKEEIGMQRACFQKVRFGSKHLASISIAENHLVRCQPYFCNTCQGWHIGRINPIHEWKAKQS